MLLYTPSSTDFKVDFLANLVNTNNYHTVFVNAKDLNMDFDEIKESLMSQTYVNSAFKSNCQLLDDAQELSLTKEKLVSGFYLLKNVIEQDIISQI